MFLSVLLTPILTSPFTAEDPLMSKWRNPKFLKICSNFILDGLRVSTFFINLLFLGVNNAFNKSLKNKKMGKKVSKSDPLHPSNSWSVFYSGIMMNYSGILLVKACIYSNSINVVCSISPLHTGQSFVTCFRNSALILNSHSSVTSIIYCI